MGLGDQCYIVYHTKCWELAITLGQQMNAKQLALYAGSISQNK